jgi:hypothetical protein
MTLENRLLLALSAVSGVVATVAGLVVAELASALTFQELWWAVTVLLSVLLGLAAVPLFVALEQLASLRPRETGRDR